LIVVWREIGNMPDTEQRDNTEEVMLDELRDETASFFRKIDWAAFWTATLISFAVYFYTLAPTVTLEDSGELATASAYLGVPHPPGYPIWTIITWIFTKIFSFVTYLGQPNPAWSVGLASGDRRRRRECSPAARCTWVRRPRPLLKCKSRIGKEMTNEHDTVNSPC